jgi:molybdopterin-guanine dinucleotide biosynthesis protein A
MNRAGFVLVGGASSRMGRDKAWLPYCGVPLARHVASRVLEAAGAVALVGPPERYSSLGFPVIPDAFPGSGPLGGVRTALEASEAQWNLVAACDMPGLEPAFLTELFDAAEREGGDVLVPVSPEGRPEPLCAVWRLGCAGALRKELAQGVRKVAGALAELRVTYWPVRERAWLENLNTPQDWARRCRRDSGKTHRPPPGPTSR